MRKGAIIRIRIITAIVLTLSLLLIVRLYQLQILDYDKYIEKGEKQYVYTVQNLYSRGNIFLTTKEGDNVSAATIQGGYVLAIDPTKLNNIDDTYNKLSEIITLDHDSFKVNANKKKRTYIEINKKINVEQYEKIIALNITGVFLYKTQWRYYPGGSLGARTIGFVGYSGKAGKDKLIGRYGLERQYNDILTRDNEHLSVNFFAEIFSNLGEVIFDAKEGNTGDIITTLEPTVLRVLNQQLQKTNDKWDSKLTGGIIINPQSGEIFAMGVVPTFDLNDRRGVSVENFRSPLVENVYEMGSIIKALTMASGIDAGVVTAETTYNDYGHIKLDDFTISNYDGKGRGIVNMQEVLKQSLNTGVSFVAAEMGKELFRKYFLSLKLGSETGIDLPNETHGLVNNLNSPRDVEYATASFGQGIALTPIETVRALSTLGNGGVLITPHIVKEIEFLNGTKKEVKYPEGERVFSKETSEEISRMLTVVVDEALRGGKVALPNYSVAAKTGTAQIADKINGGYYDDRYLHSFFGYFPSYDPKFLVFLYTVEPKNIRYASQTLTAPFMELTKFLINYYDIPPDR